MILDSSFIIDLMEGLPEAVEKLRRLNQLKENCFITSITIFELWSGIAQSDKPEQEKRKVLDILESQLILNFDKPSAEEAGKIDGMLTKQGMTIDPEDSMIAGIAKMYNKAILTRNVKHFQRVQGIQIETY